MLNRFSQAADNNKGPIADVLRRLLPAPATVLEIGSGSGQHALYFTGLFPHLTWQPTDRGEYFEALCENVAANPGPNLGVPLMLDLAEWPWPLARADVVYAANVIHIAAAELGEALIRGAGSVLGPDGRLLLYGPFRYGGAFTTPSNADFDEWLKARDPASGIRDIEWVTELAATAGLDLAEDIPMPANNQFLVFTRVG